MRETGDLSLMRELRDGYEPLFCSLASDRGGLDLDRRDEVISQCNISLIDAVRNGEEIEGASFTTYLIGSIMKKTMSSRGSCNEMRRRQRYASKLSSGMDPVGDVFTAMDDQMCISGIPFEEEIASRDLVRFIIDRIDGMVDGIRESGHLGNGWKDAMKKVLRLMLIDEDLRYEDMAMIISDGKRRFGKSSVWAMVGRIRRMASEIIGEIESE